jgi:hypothetical protein
MRRTDATCRDEESAQRTLELGERTAIIEL